MPNIRISLMAFRQEFLKTTLRVRVGFPGGSVIKNLPANAKDMNLIPGLRRSPRKGNGNPSQYSCLGNPMDRVAWQATVQWSFKESHATEHTGTACRHGTATYISQSVQSLSHV